jgi:hypothetical protein
MEPYRVYLAKEIIAQLKNCKRSERELITRFFEEIADNPYQAGGFIDHDDVGRDIQVKVIGRYALYFWSDHLAKEVKVIGLKAAGH